MNPIELLVGFQTTEAVGLHHTGGRPSGRAYRSIESQAGCA
jgi:hypothetical protein